MIALTDLDSVLHIVANVQYKAGNRDNDKTVKAHVKRFIRTVEKNSGADRMLRFFQDKGHDNYRNEILPEYKSHRKKSDAIECWKPTIVEAFQEMHAIALTAIESDDAINVVARDLKEEYNIAYVGSGSLEARMEKLREQRKVPESDVFILFKKALKIVKKRTKELFPNLLPANEHINVELIGNNNNEHNTSPSHVLYTSEAQDLPLKLIICAK